MRKTILVLLGGMIFTVLSGCAGTLDSRLEGTLSALETQVARQEEWISYQATQIGQHQELLSSLATRVPGGASVGGGTITPTPFSESGLSGSVVIHGGACCVGGTAGDMISIDVQFEAQSAGGEVVEMRVITARAQIDPEQMAEGEWMPFRMEESYQIVLPGNWTSFWVFVQYRDSRGVVSEIYSDEIAVEGMPPDPTPTP